MEFNLIDEPWIRVMRKDCSIEEISLKQVFQNAASYEDLAGECKTQDFAILRLLLAILHTAKSIENVPTYLEKWRERFNLFDEKYPFYQSNAVKDKSKPINTAKMIGTLYESNNKKRLFSSRYDRNLSFSEAARWLLHLNCFDDIAAKKPTPKKPYVGHLGLIALKGKNLLETLQLNFYPDDFEQHPSWEQDNNTVEFNHCIEPPQDQAGLLSLMSRRILLVRDNDTVTGYWLAGGEYFEELDVPWEQMTLWRKYEEKKEIKFRPLLHTPERPLWQEIPSFLSMDRMPGILENLTKSAPDDYIATIETAAIAYNFQQATSLVVKDSLSDIIQIKTEILKNTEQKILFLSILKKCDKTQYFLKLLHKNIQNAAGRRDKDIKIIEADSSAIEHNFNEIMNNHLRYWLLDSSYPLEDNIKEDVIKLGKNLAKNTFSEGLNIFIGRVNHVFFYNTEDKEPE